MQLRSTSRRIAMFLLTVAAGLVGATSAQARTADVYSGYSSKVGQLKSTGLKWTVYQGYSDRIGEVRVQGSKCIVYSG